jgi:predicted PurR-regulated permease PerM
MRFNGQNPTGNGFTTLASFVIIAAVLYLAKEVFIPIALAVLLSFLLTPLVVRLSRWRLGKVLPVVIVVTLAFTAIGVVSWVVMAQVVRLAEELPRYQQNLHAKVEAFRAPKSSGLVSKASSVVKEFRKEVESLNPAAEDGTGPNEDTSEKPLPVEIKKPKLSPFELVGSVLGPVVKPLVTAAAVVFLVILMLIQREDLRERFLKLVSGGELNVATQAVDDATQRVSRYLLMQLVVNASYGIPIGIGLYFIGVPNAFLWGLLAMLLRFIPFLGLWIAATCPILLAFAVDPGWLKAILAVFLYLVVEVLCTNLVEPWLYGASTGVSTVALLMAAVFWTWLWGTVGLLLSTPLTVCLLVLGKYVPGLSFLSVLLGSHPVLPPEARFYQRMLAMDDEELLAVSESFVKERSLTDLYDSVIIPALGLAEQDRHKGTLAEVRQTFIVQNTRELIELMAERDDASGEPGSSDELPPESPASPILCIPAKDDADELAALMLEQLLVRRGLPARALSVKTLGKEWSNQIRTNDVQTVCICGIPPYAVAPARLICRRLKHEFPRLYVIVGIWSLNAQPTELVNRLGSSCHDALVTSLSEALARLEDLTNDPAHRESLTAVPGRAPALVEHPPEREEVFDSIARRAAKIVNVPVSLVSLIDTDQEFWKAHGGLPPDMGTGEVLRETSLGGNGSGSSEIIDVEDITRDARFSEDVLLRERGIRFYVGVPLKTSAGHVVGKLCITHTKPHRISDSDKTRLRNLAERLMLEVESRERLKPELAAS